MKVIATWKVSENLKVTHTFVVEAQNIEQAIDETEKRYPDWILISLKSKE